MSELILHHYALSPFGEKLRLALGHKRLAWRSVEVAIWPPRPELAPMTAGFRRTPVLQVGADLYCDTMLILGELERRHPEPALHPPGLAGQATALAWWAETTMFMAAAAVTTSVIGDGIPEAFLADRAAFMQHDFSAAASRRDLPVNRQRTAAQMALLARMLGDGRPFLLGAAPSAADLAAYHPLWFAQKNGGAEVAALLPFAPLEAWMARVAAIGHGAREAMEPAAALAVARAAAPAPVAGVPAGDPSGLSAGQRVRIHADSPAGAIEGTLVAADAERLVLSHEDAACGTVHVHLPRFGYSAVAA